MNKLLYDLLELSYILFGCCFFIFGCIGNMHYFDSCLLSRCMLIGPLMIVIGLGIDRIKHYFYN